jgi:hypothetical protein
MNDQGDEPPLDTGALSKDGTFAVTRSDYSDARNKGDFHTRYPASAWLQIGFEGIYLGLVIILALGHIIYVATGSANALVELRLLLPLTPESVSMPFSRAIKLWSIVGLSGVLGAASFSLKWLYHSVAWREWNRDRLIWRLSVPVQGGLLALFTGSMVMSGIIPLLSKALFLRVVSCAAFGFFVGLFADNFLAALQKFAFRILGTLGKSA